MHEESRIIDAVPIIQGLKSMQNFGYDAIAIDGMVKALNEAPEAKDKVVVHCVDCKHLYFKDFQAYCPERVHQCRPDGYCDLGERRDKPEADHGA